MPPSNSGPEAKARENIDAALEGEGWQIQDRDRINLSAGRGVAIREFKLASGHGFADYLLFVDGKAVGVLEAKPEGHTLTGVEPQAQKYSEGVPDSLQVPLRPLPFLYISTGAVTRFTNLLDPKPRSRRIFGVHRPETLAEWLQADTLNDWVKILHPEGGLYTAADETKPSSLRARLQTLPSVELPELWPNQLKAVVNLEHSLKHDRPRALIQMATGSGKTITAISFLYRLIKFGGARRVLFLVDRSNLGQQAEKEFKSYRTPDDRRKFDELYNVQRLTSNKIGSASKVVISTIQRLFSMLRGDEEFEAELEEGSQFDTAGRAPAEPVSVVYNAGLPPEFFDVIVVDECHRSIYSLWRQVLEYFDAFLVGLTATPAKHTYGFFNKNLVMEYAHDQAVADGVNVDFELYKIRTQITKGGSRVEAGPATVLGYRERQTRKVRWENPDEDLVYGAEDLDRKVVAKDQIRTMVRAFRERLFTEIFPGRKHVPKTLVFAKDDSHAEDIVDIIREEFGEGNDFCQKITYKTTGKKPQDLIQDFRNSYYPRIAVTVDMVATGTDIKPVEIVMFMRVVKSRVLFEQMKGRGVRVIDRTDLQAVTPDARAKTHFIIVDCVGVVDQEISDTKPLERKKAVSFKALMEHVALGGNAPDMISSLASRLSRLDKQCDPADRGKIEKVSGGLSLKILVHGMIEALDADKQVEAARKDFKIDNDQEPTDEQLAKASEILITEALEPLAANPDLRNLIIATKQTCEQIIDTVSIDEVIEDETGFSEEAKEKAKALVESFEKFLQDNKDEIDALQFFFSVPYRERLRFEDIKALAEAIKAPPRQWTPERLWRAYETLQADKVRGANAQRLLTDIVSLIRYALHQEEELVPYGEQVKARFENWMAQQKTRGRSFTDDQKLWLAMIRDHIATSLAIDLDAFDLTPFVEKGGLGKAAQVFGGEIRDIIQELNEALVA